MATFDKFNLAPPTVYSATKQKSVLGKIKQSED